MAWHHMGWKPLGFSEIEPFPSAVLKHHYPHVPNLGDMTKHKEWTFNERLDLLVGGTPCQAFSVAGARRSLDDERGNLTLTFCNIADQFNPEFTLWENVPGVLNTHDGAFGCLLAGLAGFDEALQSADGKWRGSGMVIGRRRRVAWVTLDAQFFGVPQRRRRIFVLAVDAQSVADSPEKCPSKILALGQSLRRDTPSRRKAGEVAPRDLTGCASNGCFDGFTPSSHGDYRRGLGTLRASGGDLGGGSEQLITIMAHGQANAEIRSDGGSPSLTCNHEAPIIAIQDGRGLEKKQNGCGFSEDGISYTLDSVGGQAVAFKPGISKREGSEGRFVDELCPTLRKEMGDNQPAVCYPLNTQIITRGGALGRNTGFGMAQDGEPAYTLQAGHSHGVCFNAEVSPCRGKESMSPTKSSSGQMIDFCIASQMQVRRLTPEECEALQGFPEDYTNIPWRKKPESPGGPRYKALGNSMAVPVMRYIGERIQEVLK